MMLEHLNPDCTGWWRLEYVDGVPHVRCNRCGALVENTGGIGGQLAMEADLTTALEQLTEEGRDLS
jgi:hypothetical protein